MLSGFMRKGSVSPVFNSPANISSTAIAGLDTGGFVVTATHITDGILGQKFAASGVRDGLEFGVNTTTANAQIDSAITAFSNGSFLVTWQSNLQDGSEWGIFAQRYDASGASIGGEFQVNSTSLDAQTDPTITSLNNGSFVVVWQSDNQDGSDQGIYGQRYKADGATKGGEFKVNTETLAKQNDPNITALADGGYVVVWTSADQDGDGKGIYGQRYKVGGAKMGGEFAVNTTTQGDQRDAVVTGLDDGGYVVTWEAETPVILGSPIIKNIMGQRFNAAGVATGPEFQVTSASDKFQTDPSITTLADGGFVIVWEYFRGPGEKKDVFGQRYDANGSKIGGNFEISVKNGVNQEDASVTSIADGGFAVAFHETESGSNTVQIFQGQLFGTSAANTISDTVGANWINGRGGNDTLNGLGGKDTIFGELGRDTLNGGGGNDRLNGGASNDILNGGSGNDRLDGGKGRDVLNGGKGKDTLLGGVGVDKLFGNGGNDTLKGNGGNDRLAGGAGNDKLFGGAGRDVFVYANAAGEGKDRIKDLADGLDKIDLSSFNLANFAAINASQVGTDIKLDLGANKTLFIDNMLLADFDVSDVIL